MKHKIFITGISTDVGKTVVSAIIVEALKADYWKPVQSGDLEHSDTHKIKSLLTNQHIVFHKNSYALNTPMSPHAAAAIDGVQINLEAIKEPTTENNLIIEGAGGLLVPLNEKHTVLDLIHKEYKVILVSRHYLGSINHTLLSINELKNRGLDIAIVFNGAEHPTSEQIIKTMGNVTILGRIDHEEELNIEVIKKYAEKLYQPLVNWLHE